MTTPPDDQSNTGWPTRPLRPTATPSPKVWTPSVWADPETPPNPPTPSPTRRRALIAVIVLAVAGVAAAGIAISRKPGTPSATSGPSTTTISYPRNWDPRIAPLAAEASRLRKLNFKHPVHVEFLTAGQYTVKAAGTKDDGDLSKKDRADLANYVALYRSVGLLNGDVDLHAALTTLSDTGTLAFYDPVDKHVYIRGTKVTVALRITLVHELTHVLQDQHFDLLAMQQSAEKSHGDSMAVHALIEGDAEAIENRAVDELTPAERKSYLAAEASAAASLDAKRLKALPKVLLDSFSAPYDFGQQFVKILKGQGGEAAINEAFRKPPTAFAEVWNPFAYLADQKTLAIDPPPLPGGAKKVDASQVGSFDTFLVLAERMPALQALDAADRWRGDQSLTYAKDGTVCTDISMRGSDTLGAAILRHAWRTWAKAMPDDMASVRDLDDFGVAIHTCDPGPDVDLNVTNAGDKALVYPVGRLQIAVSALDESKKGAAIELSARAAYCFADAVIRIAPADALTGEDEDWKPDEAQKAKMTGARDSCVAAYP